MNHLSFISLWIYLCIPLAEEPKHCCLHIWGDNLYYVSALDTITDTEKGNICFHNENLMTSLLSSVPLLANHTLVVWGGRPQVMEHFIHRFTLTSPSQKNHSSANTSLLCQLLPAQLQGFLLCSKIKAVIYVKDRKSRKSYPCGGTAFLNQSLQVDRGEGQRRLQIYPYSPMCKMKKCTLLNSPLTECLHWARGQCILLAALMAFHPPQVSRNSCNVLGGSLRTAPSRVTEVHQT